MSTPLPPVAGVIGWPVAHSKSPLIHRFWLQKLGLDGDYSRFPVHPDNLAAALRSLPVLGLRGVNVTVPHKIAVMAHLDDITPSARNLSAVNTVIVGADGRLAGANTDVEGVLEPIRALAIRDRAVIIAGTGGAARAALAAVRLAGAGHVTLLARDAAKAAALLQDAGQHGAILPLGGSIAPNPDAVLLFNATSLGMAGMPPLPVDVAELPAAATVFDAVYAPLETPLLAAARARGMRTIDGLRMLVGQAAAAFEMFFGHPAPRQHDAELRELLTR